MEKHLKKTRTAGMKERIVKVYLDFVDAEKVHPIYIDFKPFGITTRQVQYYFGSLDLLREYIDQKHPNKLKDVIHKKDVKDKNIKDNIEKIYLEYIRKNGHEPSLRELLHLDIRKDIIRWKYGSYHDFKKQVSERNFDEIKYLYDEFIYSKSALEGLEEELKKYKRFIITTVVEGQQTHVKFYKNLKVYCEKNNAKLLLLLCRDPAAVRKYLVPKELREERFVFNDTTLNNNLFINTIKLSAKHLDPITGLGRIGQRNGSFIYANPKQRLFYSPVRNKKLPHALMTTGSITLPDYETDRYLSKRTAYIANYDHVFGAIIVEIQNEEIYHFRQVQADKNGTFIDLGVQYKNEKTSSVRPEEFILGDWHSGETDPVAKKVWKQVVDELRPKGIILHDVFDGKSINHYDRNKKATRAILYAKDRLSLEKELRKLAEDLNELQTWVERVTIIKSNHDEFLEEILDDGRHIHDPINYNICSRLVVELIAGHNPLEKGASFCGLQETNIRWLTRDQDYVIAQVELAAHGDQGPNGSRGTIKNVETAYGHAVIGHSHTPGILRGVFQVGTSSYLKQDYQKGPSSWMQTSCLLYPNGSRQLINVIEGFWRLENKDV